MKEAKETGLILKAPAVLAFLEGRKTQHRFFLRNSTEQAVWTRTRGYGY